MSVGSSGVGSLYRKAEAGPGRYRGRIAPSPTGLLHAGHALTFWRAQERARTAGGKLILRVEDIDQQRCRPEFYDAAIEDLRWFGLEWDEGPDVGGPHTAYRQSGRTELYRTALATLREGGFIYPCHCSRKDVSEAAAAPHHEMEEPIYPGTCRPISERRIAVSTEAMHWRFRVPEGEEMRFADQRAGEQMAIAGKNFGDFIVWRKDDVPAYQLAVVVDDADMGVTEVVRGEDLLLSTFRQLLIYRALGFKAPVFYHSPLIRDADGKRLAKRHASLTIRSLRQAGMRPEQVRARYQTTL